MTSKQRYIAARMEDCDVVFKVTYEQAKRLPGFLGRLVPNMLAVRGHYDCTLDGMKALFVPAGEYPNLVPPYATRKAGRDRTLAAGK